MKHLGLLNCLFYASLILTGCKSRDDVLYAYGTLAFIVYMVLVVSSVALHNWHSLSWFQNLRHFFRKIVRPLSCLAIPIGSIIALLSLVFSVFGSTSGLGVFVGTSIVILFYSLKQWGDSDQLEKQRLYIKIAQLSLTFLIVFLFLGFGGDGIE